jgi:hypothetical protein
MDKNKDSRRPRFNGVFDQYKLVKGLTNEKIAEDLWNAGYRPGQSGKLYPSKVSRFLHRNEDMPDEFFRWLDRVYGIDDRWRVRFMFAEWEDRLKRPIQPGKGWL